MTDEEFNNRWNDLTTNQKNVVREYAVVPTKAAAARECDLAPSTVYDWNEDIFELSHEIVDRRTNNLMDAVGGLSENAVSVLKRALDPDTEVDRTTQETAEYIINRLEGKPTRHEKVEGDHSIEVSEEDIDDALDQL